MRPGRAAAAPAPPSVSRNRRRDRPKLLAWHQACSSARACRYSSSPANSSCFMLTLLFLAEAADQRDQLANLPVRQRITPRGHDGGASRSLTASLDDREQRRIGLLLHDRAVGEVGGTGIEPGGARSVPLASDAMTDRADLDEGFPGVVRGQREATRALRCHQQEPESDPGQSYGRPSPDPCLTKAHRAERARRSRAGQAGALISARDDPCATAARDAASLAEPIAF